MIEPSTDVDAEGSSVESEALDLRVSDRCERCGAQAFVITMHEAGPLLWCAHHYNAHEDALGALKVLDRRDRLNTSPSVSAY